MSDTFNGGGPVGTCNNAIDHYTKCLRELDTRETELLHELETIRGRREHLTQMQDQWIDAKSAITGIDHRKGI